MKQKQTNKNHLCLSQIKQEAAWEAFLPNAQHSSLRRSRGRVGSVPETAPHTLAAYLVPDMLTSLLSYHLHPSHSQHFKGYNTVLSKPLAPVLSLRLPPAGTGTALPPGSAWAELWNGTDGPNTFPNLGKFLSMAWA